MLQFRTFALALIAALCLQCSRSGIEIPVIEGWTGEPQVAAKIETARREALDRPNSAEAVGRLGMIFQAHELHAEAIVCYRRAADLAPADGRWPYLAALSERHDDLEEAVALFEQAAARGMSHAAFHVNFGDLLARLGQGDRAVDRYEKALELDSRVTHALHGLARLALAEGDPEVAREYLERASRIAPWHGEVRTLLAQTYQRLGRSQDAERELRAAGAFPEPTQAADPVYQAVEDEAVTTVAYKKRARRLAGEGRYAEAEALYRKVLEIRTGTASDYSDLGGALAGQNRIDQAIELYRKALDLDEDEPHAHNNLAMALAQKGDLEGAVDHLSRAVDIEPNYPEAHHNLGLVRAGQKRHTEAIGHYERSLALNPSFTSAHNDLGTAWAALGNLDNAMASWRAALEIDPRELSALHNLSVALARSGRHREALEWLETGLEIAPNSSRLNALLAWELATAPQPDLRDGAKAVALARRVHEAYPNQPGMGNILAAALAESGDFESATEVAERAVGQALATGQLVLAAEIEKSMSGYRRGLPFRQAR